MKHFLHELPFFDELNVVEISKAFKGYTRNNRLKGSFSSIRS